jgi:hypothetical protein
LEKIMDRKTRLAGMLLAIVVAVGLLSTAACSRTIAPKCSPATWTEGPVTVVSPVALRSIYGPGARSIEVIGKGETLYPEMQYACKGEVSLLGVEHNGKAGWIVRSHTAKGIPSPTPTPTPTSTRS